MARPRGNNPEVNSIVPDQPDMPDTLRRRDSRIDRPDSLPETSDNVARGGDSPSTDGDNPHPVHDEDQEDLEPDDFEDMVDELQRSDPEPVTLESDEE
jgi:hypothetical protein